MSADIRKKLEEEIHALEKELREELPAALKKAAALGDLSENADYSAARERQDFVRVRLGQLKQRVADLSLINFDKIPRDRISLGSTTEDELSAGLGVVRRLLMAGPEHLLLAI